MVQKRSKYGSKKVKDNDILFDSQLEHKYYLRLKQLKEEGHIKDFEVHKDYILQEEFINFEYELQEELKYESDFVVYHNDGSVVVLDTKGMELDEARIKRLLFMAKYPELPLYWIAESKKYSDTGWIDWHQLEAIRECNRKIKGLKTEKRKQFYRDKLQCILENVKKF